MLLATTSVREIKPKGKRSNKIRPPVLVPQQHDTEAAYSRRWRTSREARAFSRILYDRDPRLLREFLHGCMAMITKDCTPTVPPNVLDEFVTVMGEMTQRGDIVLMQTVFFMILDRSVAMKNYFTDETKFHHNQRDQHHHDGGAVEPRERADRFFIAMKPIFRNAMMQTRASPELIMEEIVRVYEEA